MNNIKKIIVGFISTVAMVAIATTSASAYTYTRDLTVGSIGTDVVALQSFLESRGYLTMPAGVAKGYFGVLTRSAVASFQAGNGIQPPAGYFGIITRTRVMALENTSTPPTSSVPGCMPGAMFSSTTGASCSGSTVPGCFPGAMFSPLTGARCDGSTPPNNNNDPTLSGSDGTISDVSELSQFNNEEVGEGEEDVKVLGFEVEASNDGDIRLTSIKVSFDPSGNTGSNNLDDYIEGVSIWQGDDEIGSSDVEDFNEDDDDTFSRTITLSSDAIVRSDESERFYVTVNAGNNFDSSDISGDSWTVDVDSIRFEDGSGVVTTDTGTGDINDMNVTINFVSFSTAADTELKISTDSDSPEEGVILVDNDNTTDDVVLLKGNIDVEGSSDITLDELPVTLTTTNAASVNAVTGSVKLTIDGEEFTESVSIGSTSGTVVFDNLDLVLDAGETYEFTISADINDIDSPNFEEGDDLKASITSSNRDSIDAENEEGDQLDNGEKSGTATGEAQDFRTEGIMATLVSTDTEITQGSGASDDLGTFKIRFKVSAEGDTVYIPADVSDAVDYVVDKAGAVVSTGLSATITNVTDDDETNDGNYEIEEGDDETFELIVTVQLPTAGTSGQYRLTLTGIGWDTSDDSSPANTYASNLDGFRTSYVGLN